MANPIRVGFIGLRSSDTPQLGGTWGQKAHITHLEKSPDYTITALCNSSVEAAERAVKLYGFDPAKVRAYGDPESLAKDPEVDLVVCSVKVAQHYPLIRPALLAGKMVFCEWPLASNLSQMQELADLATSKNLKTMVGLQGRNGPYVKAIRDVVGDGPGQIGKVLSTSMTSYAMLLGTTMPQDLNYMSDIKSGGSIFTISAIHLLDTVTAALGGIKSYHTLLKNQRPTVAAVDLSSKVVEPNRPNTTHDHIFVHGLLEGDVPFNFQLRGGMQFKDTPPIDWRVYGTKGEIRITSTQLLWMGSGIKAQVYDFADNTVRDVDLDAVMDKDDVGVRYGYKPPADNVARLYEAFAKGETAKYLDFSQSLKWANFIQQSFESN